MSNVATSTASELTISGLADLQNKEAQLKELKKQLKIAKDRKEWEAKTQKLNPQYVVGSLRVATAEDEAALSHCHGQVADIKCQMCGKVRVVNKQDAFQVKFCEEHKKEARKAKAKAKRLEKALSGKSVEDVQAQIDALNDQLSEMEG
jgi:NAD-dependent SIR2 family protein deacetylase